MDLIARKSFRYRGRMLKAGEPFQADRKHGKVLVATNRAQGGTYRATTPEPVTKAAKPNPIHVPITPRPAKPSPASLPSLKGKSKAKLLEIADRETVAIPDRDASNSVIAAAIQAKRDAAS